MHNGGLDSVQCGLLHVKLGHLAKWNAQRRVRAAEYNRLLVKNDAVMCPYEPSWSRAVYHLYVISTEDRDGLMAHLKAADIGTGIHYPVPLHLQKAYHHKGYTAHYFPVTTRIAGRILSLPMYPQLTAEQQQAVVSEIGAFTGASPGRSIQKGVSDTTLAAGRQGSLFAPLG